jgi:cobalt-zinc-cadmium efflux system membrane fusion protein
MERLKKPLFIFAGALLALALAGLLGPSAAVDEGTSTNREKHQDHSEKSGHKEEGDHEEVIGLTADEIKEFGVEVLTVGSGQLQVHVEFPGEVVINPDRLTHLVPRVSGVAQVVYKQLGDRVKAGEVLAVLESRELSEMKSSYLVAKERMALAETTFKREEKLWKESISSEREYLDAQNKLAAARIEMRAAEQKLHALGFSESYLTQLSFSIDEQFIRYEIVAPFEGTVVGKHISLGEMLKDDAEVFVVADLSTVWVNLTVYQNDLPFVYKGQAVQVFAGTNMPSKTAPISYISPTIDEATRTAWARVVLPNPHGKWRPGAFVTGKVAIEKVATVEVMVFKAALQTVGEQTVVFVETDDGFEPQPVMLGRANDTHVEITAGLTPGQRYVARGSFVLKAELAKGAFDGGHNH